MLQSITVVVFFYFLAAVVPSASAVTPHFDSRADFQKHLQMLNEQAPDPCVSSSAIPVSTDSEDHESRLFDDAANLVEGALIQASAGSGSPRDRAAATLDELRDMSATVNADWPKENRFRYRILEAGPLLVVQMSVRTYDAFRAFAMTGSPGADKRWGQVGTDGKTVLERYSGVSLTLHPLYSGTAGRVRFLAEFGISGCAGSYGIEYDAWEWNPRESSSLDQIISQSGSLGLDDVVPGFEQIGKLDTEGRKITLPYCWFSAIDTWDNPSLCAVDTYDLSDPRVRFQSRQVNRPDLLPIAKVIEFAQRHDYPAVRAYSDSDATAQKLVREIPPLVFGETELKVTHFGKHRERVRLGDDDDPVYQFDVAERRAGWVVTGFSAP